MKFLDIKFTLVAVFIGVLLILNHLSKPHHLAGRVDSDFVARLEAKSEYEEPLILTSGGGDVRAAYEAAKIILNNKNGLIVKSYCLSACAEDLLPAGHSIQLIGQPIIGFHHNSFMNYHQITQFSGDNKRCSYEYVEFQEEIYRWKNLNTNFWRETANRLELIDIELIEVWRGCPRIKRNYMHDFWLPTSIQLRELWGLKFTGETCADDLKRSKMKVNRIWREGESVVIGDLVYVSKGR